MDRRFVRWVVLLVVLVRLAACAAAERHRLGHCESSTAVAALALALLHELITFVEGKWCVLGHTDLSHKKWLQPL
jgi:hypothetical protein